jgi:hypothetical protein
MLKLLDSKLDRGLCDQGEVSDLQYPFENNVSYLFVCDK